VHTAGHRSQQRRTLNGTDTQATVEGNLVLFVVCSEAMKVFSLCYLTRLYNPDAWGMQLGPKSSEKSHLEL
jgi:hypothetical protein